MRIEVYFIFWEAASTMFSDVEINDSVCGALCHAVGHAGATVHVGTHALGLPMYELTAIVLKYGKDNFTKLVSKKLDYYYNRLLYWQENTDKLGLDWADFLKV